eukprot:gene3478-2429_t
MEVGLDGLGCWRDSGNTVGVNLQLFNRLGFDGFSACTKVSAVDLTRAYRFLHFYRWVLDFGVQSEILGFMDIVLGFVVNDGCKSFRRWVACMVVIANAGDALGCARAGFRLVVGQVLAEGGCCEQGWLVVYAGGLQRVSLGSVGLMCFGNRVRGLQC